jgi:hypothetical protein
MSRARGVAASGLVLLVASCWGHDQRTLNLLSTVSGGVNMLGQTYSC